MCFDGVHRPSGSAVPVIDARVPEERVGGIAEHLQVARIGHVTVVVDPLGPHVGLQQSQRLLGGGDTRAGAGSRGFVQTFLERPQGGAGADVVGLQHLLDRDQVVVPQSLQLADRASGGLRLRARDHLVDQRLGQLRGLESGPRPFQARSELPEHVTHAALTAGQVIDQAGAHGRPAQARAVHDRVVELAGGGHALIHHVQELAPQRFLQPVGEMARHLAAHPQGMHADVGEENAGGVQGRGRGLSAADQLHQRQQVHGVERMRDQEALRRQHVALQIRGHEAGGAGGDHDIGRRMMADSGEHPLLELQLLGDVLLDEIRLPCHRRQVGGE